MATANASRCSVHDDPIRETTTVMDAMIKGEIWGLGFYGATPNPVFLRASY
jgi:hypothetical protein